MSNRINNSKLRFKKNQNKVGCVFKLRTQRNVEGDNNGSKFIIIAIGIPLKNIRMNVLACDRACDIIVELISFI